MSSYWAQNLQKSETEIQIEVDQQLPCHQGHKIDCMLFLEKMDY